MKKILTITALVLMAVSSFAGEPKFEFDSPQETQEMSSVTFASDLAFMKEHTPIVLLKDGDAAVAVAPAYQGRVMTSTFDSAAGPSFGWINRPVIEKGLLSDEEKTGKLEEHIYIFGGEERFWFGPEGGQFAVFFKPGAKFEFDDWVTPPAIDTEAFEVVEQSATCLLYTSPSPRDQRGSRMPSSA